MPRVLLGSAIAALLLSTSLPGSAANSSAPAKPVSAAMPAAAVPPGSQPQQPVAPAAAGQNSAGNSEPDNFSATDTSAQQPNAASSATAAAAPAPASTEGASLKEINWSFQGMTGKVDRQAAQRGFQIYHQVCSACHSMNLVTYRSLAGIGFSEGEIKALAAEKQVEDYNDKGERIQRKALPSDPIVPPYPNENASRAANNGAYPPDLSLIVKARHDGPDYVYSLLTGFSPAPKSETPVANKYYNPYFPGHWISMPPPLSDNAVTFQDGTPATVDQMAHDVVNFLQWAAEPEMEKRHEMGIKVLLYLAALIVFFYFAKKRVWRSIRH